MKKARVTRRMLEAYVQKLLVESTGAVTEDGEFFVASPTLSAPVFTAVFGTGGTDFGQAFENIENTKITQN